MSESNFSRRNFLKASTLAGLGASLAGAFNAQPAESAPPGIPSADISQTRPRSSGQKPVHDLTTKPLDKVRVGVIGLHRGMTHVESSLGIEFSEVVAVCDLVNDRAVHAADVCEKKGRKRPAIYGGTGATFFDYPARLAINDPKSYGLISSGSHEWLPAPDLATMREKFTHPLWKKLAERSKGGGHGGMDFVMNWRLLDCLRQGITPDSVVYDAAAWSCIIETSVRSVATGSMPVNIPDFTRGLWKIMKPLAIAG